MRRVLVPLDGSPFSAAILDDARRLAGARGKLILLHFVPEHGGVNPGSSDSTPEAIQAQHYLDSVAAEVRAQGMSASTLVLPTRNIPLAIDEAANATWADFIACATYSQEVAGPVLRGSIAWRALAHSPVPVLLHRTAPAQPQRAPPQLRHFLVPLDGSPLAESALPLALELGDEWQARVTLIRVTPGPPGGAAADDEERHTADAYLSAVATGLSPDAQYRVVTGPTIGALAGVITAEGVTDIVMASHGRTGLSRVVLGSTAYDLLHQVALPTIVIPASARVDPAAPLNAASP
jgi:nucleotide-binding universal stress UspA family protein